MEWCGYAADDLVLFVNSQSGPQSESLDRVFSKFCLSINTSKTETMIINLHKEVQYPELIITLRGIPLKNVTEFRYLGCCIKYNEPNTGETEVNQRIQMSQSKFAEMSSLLPLLNVNSVITLCMLLECHLEEVLKACCLTMINTC